MISVRLYKLFVLLVFIATILFSVTCSDDDTGTNTNTGPEVVGCDQVKYQGTTYNITGCQPGVASFNVTVTQNGHTASFHITCTNGCISKATVSGG